MEKEKLARLDQAYEKTSPDVRQILNRCLMSKELCTQDALTLFESSPNDLPAIQIVADLIRKREVGDKITFVNVRNINFTNVCYAGCKFCGFSRSVNSPEAWLLEIDEIVRRAVEAYKLGASEICMTGGINPKLPDTFYFDILRSIKAAVPEVHIHAFSPFEVQCGSKKTGISPDEFLKTLMSAGLDSMCGTAAEIFDHDVRKKIAPNKISTDDWIQIIKKAHRIGFPTTATIMFGHVDGPKEWVGHFDIIREIQKDTGGFTEFIPLGFTHSGTPLFKSGQARTGPTREEQIKMHAIARLFFVGHIHNIQVSWVKAGDKLALEILNSGANDLGGTLMDESITRMAGGKFGESKTPEDLVNMIRSVDRIPMRRNTLYSVLEEYPEVHRAEAVS